MKIVCPDCNGKGHVIDPLVMTFVPVISWFIAALEKDDPVVLVKDVISVMEKDLKNFDDGNFKMA